MRNTLAINPLFSQYIILDYPLGFIWFLFFLALKKRMMIIDSIGWLGSFMVVLAYALNMYKKLAADSIPYYLLNIVGSICLIANTVYHHAIPSAVVNVVWITIALIALIRKK